MAIPVLFLRLHEATLRVGEQHLGFGFGSLQPDDMNIDFSFSLEEYMRSYNFNPFEILDHQDFNPFRPGGWFTLAPMSPGFPCKLAIRDLANVFEGGPLSFAMSVDANVWRLALLAAFWPAAKATSTNVEQFPPILRVPIGETDSMFCKYPILQDTAEVSWWKEGQKAFIEPNSRNKFNVKKGRGTFTLLNVSYSDVGVYYCQVKSQQQIFGNGSGSQLIVLTPPTPLKIIRVEETSPKTRKLMCKTAAFYPKKLDIFWRRNNMEILPKMEPSITETSEGLYEASSTLEDVQPAQGKVVYTCLVSHETLKIPTSFSYIIEQDLDNINKPLILGGALGGLAIVILIIILIRIGVKAKRGSLPLHVSPPYYYCHHVDAGLRGRHRSR
ncbi:natural cytotoxicity triggering receptor 3 ligand 1-like [Mobula hypostoma]|uniref:natural cytotoxicity triggering receptor 3 ligand 1-like n=1 Tax=Mobula hypostoma TaxID=723540 RepID=UPI002FC2877B